MKKITLEFLDKRIKKIEDFLKEREVRIAKEKQRKELQLKVLALDWKHHGWTGNPRELDPEREEWQEAQEIIDLVLLSQEQQED